MENNWRLKSSDIALKWFMWSRKVMCSQSTQCLCLCCQEKEVTITMPNGETSVATVRIWNETVSNLTLMALGSSAPEILLSVIEVQTHTHTHLLPLLYSVTAYLPFLSANTIFVSSLPPSSRLSRCVVTISMPASSAQERSSAAPPSTCL